MENIILDLSRSKLAKIKNLPNILYELNLYDNRITEIENLPDSLQIICLGFNRITEISQGCFPSKLRELDLHNNNIANLFI